MLRDWIAASHRKDANAIIDAREFDIVLGGENAGEEDTSGGGEPASPEGEIDFAPRSAHPHSRCERAPDPQVHRRHVAPRRRRPCAAAGRRTGLTDTNLTPPRRPPPATRRFRSPLHEIQNIARLAVERGADFRERVETHAFHLACAQERQIGFGDADFGREILCAVLRSASITSRRTMTGTALYDLVVFLLQRGGDLNHIAHHP